MPLTLSEQMFKVLSNCSNKHLEGYQLMLRKLPSQLWQAKHSMSQQTDKETPATVTLTEDKYRIR